jgi:hypothetical protein
MTGKFFGRNGSAVVVRLSGLAAAVILQATLVPVAIGAILWDAGAGTQWWFNPVNWNAPGNPNTVLPPSNNAAGTTAGETQINLGTGAWDQGEGVVYDPTNDPDFGAALSIPFPATFNRQKISDFYLSRGTPDSNRLTIKGNLTFQGRVHVGMSSGTRGLSTDGLIVQESGSVDIPVRELDLALVDTANVGFGNGVYDYRGGTLAVSQLGGSGLRMSVGSTSNSSDGMKAGPAGIGKLVIHNPATPGYIRTKSLVTALYAGFDEGPVGPNGSEFDSEVDSNGITTGVGIFEFHYNNGATRPIQINNSMTLNNGVDRNTLGIRSSRLDIVLDAAPCLGAGCVPNTVGLFDIDFDGFGGTLLGDGDLDEDGVFNDDRVFSNLDNTLDYREGDMISATFGSIQYHWTISYSGDITWDNANTGDLASVTGPGTGVDIVLVGHSSVSDGIPGDFDNDGDVDGRDFLVWQRGNSPDPLSAADLEEWQNNYGTAPLGVLTAVPEPCSLLLCVTLPLLFYRRR